MSRFIPPGIWIPRTTDVTINERFQGPPGMGNGGYVAGKIGGSPAAKVVLQRPVPLDRPLQLVTSGPRAALLDGERELAVSVPTRAPEPVAWDSIPGDVDDIPVAHDPKDHPFPGCFVCGPANPDGLGLVFKPTETGAVAKFTPPADGTYSAVPPEYLVGALDCSTGWASYSAGEAGVLGTIEYAIAADVEPGTELLVVAEPGARTERTRRARSSIYTADGSLVGSASTVWVDIATAAQKSA